MHSGGKKATAKEQGDKTDNSSLEVSSDGNFHFKYSIPLGTKRLRTQTTWYPNAPYEICFKIT